MHGVDAWYRQLRWNATAHGWIARTEDVSIFVSEQAYEEQMCAYYARQGKERKTYSEIMRPAEAEWREQGDIEQALQQDIDYWLTCDVKGVSVRTRGASDEEQRTPSNAREHLLTERTVPLVSRGVREAICRGALPGDRFD